MRVPTASPYVPDLRLLNYYRYVITKNTDELLNMIDPDFSALSDIENETDTGENNNQVDKQSISNKVLNLQHKPDNVEISAVSQNIIPTVNQVTKEDINGNADQQNNEETTTQNEFNLTCEIIEEMMNKEMTEDDQNENIKPKVNKADVLIVHQEDTNEEKNEDQSQNESANTVQKSRRRKQTLENRTCAIDDLQIEKVDRIPKRYKKGTPNTQAVDEKIKYSENEISKETEVVPNAESQAITPQCCATVSPKKRQMNEIKKGTEVVPNEESQTITPQCCATVSSRKRQMKTYKRTPKLLRANTKQTEGTFKCQPVQNDSINTEKN